MKSNDYILVKTTEIRKALEFDLYNCALALSLTLPDVCGKIEYPNEHSPSVRYKKWYVTYVKPLYTNLAEDASDGTMHEVIWINENECWSLRCAYLHAGNYDVDKTILQDLKLHAHKRNGENYSHMIRNKIHLDMDVIDLCEKLCDAAEQYYNNIEDKERFSTDVLRIDTW